MKSTIRRQLIPVSILLEGLVGVADCDISSGDSPDNGVGFAAWHQINAQGGLTHAQYVHTTSRTLDHGDSWLCCTCVSWSDNVVYADYGNNVVEGGQWNDNSYQNGDSLVADPGTSDAANSSVW